MSKQKRHIYLIGPSGVGKTTVGKLVAQLLDLDFVDIDDVITNKVGMPIFEYFEKHGESKFREQEREAIEKLSQETQPRVFASGGGSVLDTRNIIDMKNTGHVVYLSALESDIVTRIQADTNNVRPIMQGNLKERVNQTLSLRQPCYELAGEITIATSRRDAQTVAQSVVRQLNRISGDVLDGASSIEVGSDILSQISQFVTNYRNVVLISQESIPKIYGEKIQQAFKQTDTNLISIMLPEGEEAKTLSTYEAVIKKMANEKVTRNSCVMALGGGVVGDLAGFVASTYHRGIDIIQVPTTLLAQVDSSIGGKCGINLESGKNLVGAFHQPKTIVADISVLGSLNDSDFSSGLGEVVKYALLGNEFLAQQIRDNSKKILGRDREVLEPVIRSCMKQKLHIVSLDPFERTGIRATLNLGHTLAHAIETQTKYSIAHGKAVGIGLYFAFELSFELDRISKEQRDNAVDLIELIGLTKEMPQTCRDARVLVDLMYSDKKSQGSLSMILVNSAGESELVHNVDEKIVVSVLERFIAN